MYPTLLQSILTYQTAVIDPDRQVILDKLADYVASCLTNHQVADLVYICIHNSRRSHLGQFWGAAAAMHFGISGIRTWSGGTEVTAINPRSVAALERAGFGVEVADMTDPTNPRYNVYADQGQLLGVGFSKVFHDVSNPITQFAAIMTCSAADAGCPIVAGFDIRVLIPYLDPKEADDTPAEAQTYDLRSGQIAAEQIYLMQQVKQLISTTARIR